jgi:hypothetical protein
MSHADTATTKGALGNFFLTREIHEIDSWKEFLLRWGEVRTSDEIQGLLHVGFKIPFKRYRDGEWKTEEEYDEIDRLEFYFGVADNWADRSYLSHAVTDNASDDTRYSLDLRRRLASKAFSMLCQNFFKAQTVEEGNVRGFEINRGTLVTSERLLSIIKNFFRFEDGGNKASRGISNLSRTHEHNYQLARSFLLNLVKFIWRWESVPYSRSPFEEERLEKQRAALKIRLDALKPWAIEILEQIGELDLLDELVPRFDDQCLVKLEEIALREYFYDGSTHRQVATLDEACYARSAAAWLIKKHELAKKVEDTLLKRTVG